METYRAYELGTEVRLTRCSDEELKGAVAIVVGGIGNFVQIRVVSTDAVMTVLSMEIEPA